MKTWYPAAELAGLPGMPTTKRGVNLAVGRSGWKTRETGKAREIHVANLPDATRAHLASLESANGAITDLPVAANDVRDRQSTKEAGLRQFAALPDNDPRKGRARARAWLLSCWADYAQEHGTSPASCVADFVARYRIGDIAIPEEHRAALPMRNGARSLDRATLYRWRSEYQERGIAGLMDGYGNRKGAFKVATNERLQQIVLGCVMNQPHITPTKILQFLAAEHPELGCVSEKAVERFLKRWKADNAQAFAAHVNPDQWKNRFMSAFGSQHDGIVRLNQLWELDSTPADWMLADGRHCVIGVIDMYSRRLQFRVSKTSKAEAVALAFRKAVLAWGVPESVRTDNGADYKSNRFRTVVRDLEIEHLFCMPFASEQKGTIERAMRTMSHGVMDLLPGFIGHNVAERKVIEARKSFAERIMAPGEVIEVALTAEQLQQKLDQWCEAIYGRNEHRGLGTTPWQKANDWRGTIRRIGDERALDALLSEIAGQRSVTKKGIRLDHHEYIAAELVAYIGQEVHLRRDVDDMGRVFVYDLAGQFVCVAQCPELTGISRAEVAAVSHVKQKALRQEHRQEAQALSREIKRNPFEAIVEHRIAISQNVTALPKRAEEYSTPALREHGIAARSSDVPTATVDERLQRDLEQLEAEMREPRRQPAEVFQADDPQRRYERWARLDRRIKNQEQLADGERAFWDSYPKSSEFKSMKSFYEGFGLEVETGA